MLKTNFLNVSYGSKKVLQDVSIQVVPGEILALIGPNGAGKTTFLRAVSGTVSLKSGQVLVNGQDLSQLSTTQRARMMAVVPQARQLGGAYTVEQAVMMGRTAYMGWLGRESETDKAAVRLALRQTNLEGFAERSIAKLSGGEQRARLIGSSISTIYTGVAVG